MAEGVRLSKAFALAPVLESFAFWHRREPRRPVELRSNLREVHAFVSDPVREVGTALNVAEGVRFELTRPFGLPVFKTGAFNRSATPPQKFGRENCAIGCE